MALSLNELLEAQASLKKKDEEAAGKPASMSMDQLKQLAGASSSSPKNAVGDATLVKIYQELKKQSSILVEVAKNTAKANKANSREDSIENRRAMEYQTKLLEKLVDNTKEKKEKEKKDASGISLGGIGTALAMVLGGLAGAISGYIKAIKMMNSALFAGIEKAVAWLGKFFPNLRKAFFAMEANFVVGVEMIKDMFKTFVSKGTAVFENAVGFIKGMFASEGFSKIVKVFETVKSTLTSFFAPIVEAFKVIEQSSGPVAKAVAWVGDAFTAVKDFFSMLGTKMSLFAKIFKGTMVIFEKLMIPLTIIMTVWDTIKGALEGWEKGGFVGMISGALSGLVNSLIGAPLDLLKDIVSWVLGAFGFESAEKFLDSFSFEDLIKDFFDAIFAPLKLMQDLIMHPIDTIKRIGENISNFVENIGIPEISFTIPIIDKKVSFGPYYPFKKSGAQGGATVSGGKEGEKKEVAPGAGAAQQSGGQPGATPVQQSKAPALNNQRKEWTEIAGEPVEPGKPLSAKQAAVVESSIQSGNKYPPDIMKSYEMYKSSVSTTTNTTQPAAAATPSASAATPQEAQAVYQQSGQNAAAAAAPAPVAAPTIVSAPTTNVNNTTNSIVRLPSRNSDSTLRDFYNNRYSYA